MRAGRLLPILAALTASGCEVTATQVVVSVDTDLRPDRGELDQVSVAVRSPNGEVAYAKTLDLGPNGVALPASFGVAPSNGDPRRRVTIELGALKGGHKLFSTRAITSFVEHRATRLDMFLARRCRTEAAYCPEGQTCTAQGCEPEDVDERREDRDASVGDPADPISDWDVLFPYETGAVGSGNVYVAVGEAGEVFLGGSSTQRLDFGSGLIGTQGNFYGFLAALDPRGEPLWTASVEPLTPETNVTVYGVAAGHDAVHLAGQFVGEIAAGDTTYQGYPAVFVARYDQASGALERFDHWAATAGQRPYFYLNDFEGGPDGLALSGSFWGELDLGGPLVAGPEGAGVIARMDSDHVILWSCVLPPATTVTAVALDAEGVVANILYGAPLWGRPAPVGGGNLVAALDPDDCSQARWIHQPSTSGGPETLAWAAYDLALAPGGEAVLAGRLVGPLFIGDARLDGVGVDDTLFERLGAEGTAQGGFLDGGPAPDFAYAVALDRLGRAAVAGISTGGPMRFGDEEYAYGGGPADAFVVGVGPDASPLWAVPFGGADYEWATDVAFDEASGAVLVGGRTGGPVESLGFGQPGVFVRRFVP